MYGEDFIEGTDKLESLITYNNNGIKEPQFLQLSTESSEFENKNFKGVIDSVDCKVEFLKKAIKKLSKKKLKIQNKNRYSIFIDLITHPLFQFIGWLATLVGLIFTIYTIFN